MHDVKPAHRAHGAVYLAVLLAGLLATSPALANNDPVGDYPTESNGVPLPTGMKVAPHRATDALEVRSTDTQWLMPDGVTPVAGMPVYSTQARAGVAAVELMRFTDHIRFDMTFQQARLGPDGSDRGEPGDVSYEFGGGYWYVASLMDSTIMVDKAGNERITLPDGEQLIILYDGNGALRGVAQTAFQEPDPDFELITCPGDGRCDPANVRPHRILSQISTGYSYYYGEYLESRISSDLSGSVTVVEETRHHLSRVEFRAPGTAHGAQATERLDIDWLPGYFGWQSSATNGDYLVNADATDNVGLGAAQRLPVGFQAYLWDPPTAQWAPKLFVYATYDYANYCQAVACSPHFGNIRLYVAPTAQPTTVFYPPGPFAPLSNAGDWEPECRWIENRDFMLQFSWADGTLHVLCWVSACIGTAEVGVRPRIYKWVAGYDPPAPGILAPPGTDPSELYTPAWQDIQGTVDCLNAPLVPVGDPNSYNSIILGLHEQAVGYDAFEAAFTSAKSRAYAEYLRAGTTTQHAHFARAVGPPRDPTTNLGGARHDWDARLFPTTGPRRWELPLDTATGVRPTVYFQGTPPVRYTFLDDVPGVGPLFQRGAFSPYTNFLMPEGAEYAQGRLTIEEWTGPFTIGSNNVPIEPPTDIRIVDLLQELVTAFPVTRYRYPDAQPKNEIWPGWSKNDSATFPDAYSTDPAEIVPQFGCANLSGAPLDGCGLPTGDIQLDVNCCLDITRFEPNLRSTFEPGTVPESAYEPCVPGSHGGVVPTTCP